MRVRIPPHVLEEVKLYDPRALGALCDQCPLAGQKPVPPESNPDPVGIVVAEGPGESEVIDGRPLVGATGKRRFDPLLRLAGLERFRLHITNATQCLPKSKSEKEMATAVRSCLPRLKAEIEAVEKDKDLPILALGQWAVRALTAGVKVDKERGFIRPLEFGGGLSSVRTKASRKLG